jgi:hypothetical protein
MRHYVSGCVVPRHSKDCGAPYGSAVGLLDSDDEGTITL